MWKFNILTQHGGLIGSKGHTCSYWIIMHSAKAKREVNTESDHDSCRVARKVAEISWGQSTRLSSAVHDLLKLSNLPP